MAAITPVPFSPFLVLRNVTAQASTGQTDWISVPQWVGSIIVTFNLTANAGTTPISTVSLLAPDPVARDDTAAVALFTGASITAASFHHYALGPSFTTAGTDSATASASVVQNGPIPTTIGVRVTNDRTTGDETYTYALAITFRG